MADKERIIVPVDGSEQSMHALQLADTVYTHADVVPVNVILVPSKYPLDADLSNEAEIAEETLKEAEGILKRGHQKDAYKEGEIIQSRNLGSAILDEANDRRVSTIVIGVEGNERSKNGLGKTGNEILSRFDGMVVILRAAKGSKTPPLPKYDVVRLARREDK